MRRSLDPDHTKALLRMAWTWLRMVLKVAFRKHIMRADKMGACSFLTTSKLLYLKAWLIPGFSYNRSSQCFHLQVRVALGTGSGYNMQMIIYICCADSSLCGDLHITRCSRMFQMGLSLVGCLMSPLCGDCGLSSGFHVISSHSGTVPSRAAS